VGRQRIQLRGRRTTEWRVNQLLAGSAAAIVFWGSVALADPEPQTLVGVPQQIIPEATEVGLPPFTMPTGTVSVVGGSTTGASGTSETGTSTDSSALDTMLGTSWGASAEQTAEALGVNPSAVAATCEVESGCQNVAGTGSITGAFQMSAAIYESSIAAALAQDPSLAADIVPGPAGQSDPATEAIAAAEYLKEGAEDLESDGISAPTALDVRGYYNFGPEGGDELANAPGSEAMSEVLMGTSAATLAANGISQTETVAEWRANVAAKMGSAGNATVLTS
jgi:hypothetical protein